MVGELMFLIIVLLLFAGKAVSIPITTPASCAILPAIFNLAITVSRTLGFFSDRTTHPMAGKLFLHASAHGGNTIFDAAFVFFPTTKGLSIVARHSQRKYFYIIFFSGL